MSQSELIQAVKQICDEKGIPLESVVETIEAALAAAYRKDFGNRMQNIKVAFDLETGGFRVFDIKEVVSDEMVEEAAREAERAAEAAEAENADAKDGAKTPAPAPPVSLEVSAVSGEEEEGKVRFNPKTMIGLSEARSDFPDIEESGEWKKELEVPSGFGRMAAQTAKQVIIQKLREAERDMQYAQFKDKEGMVVSGMIQRAEGRLVLVDLGNATGIMPAAEQMKSERYRVGDRMKMLLKSVQKGPKGPEIVVSRASPELVSRLFELEVPEIAAGSVEIKSVAREAGSRTKIAVVAHEENIDPIGSCVGQRGTRVQTVINELGGEKIDIIEFHADLQRFIANALAPAKVLRVELREDDHSAIAYVNEDQLSLAIGRSGQNVRLAAELSGWKINIAQNESEVIEASSDDEDSEEKRAEGKSDLKQTEVAGIERGEEVQEEKAGISNEKEDLTQ